jgi:hypothetical protein
MGSVRLVGGLGGGRIGEVVDGRDGGGGGGGWLGWIWGWIEGLEMVRDVAYVFVGDFLLGVLY